MSGFIGGVCFVQKVGEADCNDVLPPPPFPPDGDNPTHFYVSGDTGLAAATQDFVPGTNAIMVRAFGRNGSPPLPGITAKVTQNGVTTNLVRVADESAAGVNAPFCFAACGFVTPNVPATLTFALTGAAGRTHVRIGEFGSLPANFAAIASVRANLSTPLGGDAYYCETEPVSENTGLVLSVVGWLDAAADEITGTGDYPQYTAGAGAGIAGASVYFGAIEAPGGEPGWGGYVWYAANSRTNKPAAVTVAIPGATLPTP